LEEKQINSYESGDYKRRNLYIQNDLYKELGVAAAESNTDKSNILNIALLHFFAETGRMKKRAKGVK
jgi:hypothetical protein